MERDYGKEIDVLNVQLEEIKNLLTELIGNSQKIPSAKQSKNATLMQNMHPDKRISEMMEELCGKVDNDGNTGLITYFGIYASGGRQSNWIRNQVNTDDLLKLIESNAAAKVLACIGNNDRLNLLLSLMQSPKTVNQLVEQCGYNSTGQVYHHLKPLLAADLVKEEKSRGSYVIKPYRVQGIIMLLAGINDMFEPKYAQGNWEQSKE